MIPAITATTKAGKFSSRGYGLSIEPGGHHYQDVSDYLPLLEPVRGRNNRILKAQPRIQKQPLTWWKAQCIFRGLDVAGRGIEPLQTRLRAAPKAPMTRELKELEAKMDEEYNEKENIACNELIERKKAELDEKWPRMTPEEKADFEYGYRFLREEFPAGKDTNRVITVKLRSLSLFSDSARRLGLETEMLKLPRGHAEINGEFDILVVVAPSSAKFRDSEKWRTISGELKRAREEANFAARQHMFTATVKGLNWVVTGKYKITCPVIDKGWRPREDLTLEIFTQQTARGPQMFAMFNFNIIEGVMRFEKQHESGKGKTATKKSSDKKRKREESEETDDYDEYDEYDRRSPTPEQFYLGEVTMPSQKHPTWGYRWRGSETGEGEIQLGAEANRYEITFCEPRGTKIKGTFGSEYHKDCEFTGAKIAAGRTSSIDISQEWTDGNSNAHDRAWGARWH